MPEFRFKIDLGHIITIAAILLTGAAAYGKVQSDLDFLKNEFNQIMLLSERVANLESWRHDEEVKQHGNQSERR